VIEDGRLTAALFVTRDGRLPRRDWLVAQLAGGEAAAAMELLAGRPAAPQPDRGPVVCVCFDVGMNTIIEAIAAQALVSVDAVGKALSAGTNCGSCRPAIQRLIGETKEAANG
jgi:assimilatory nitrate reductase catalytic subunit